MCVCVCISLLYSFVHVQWLKAHKFSLIKEHFKITRAVFVLAGCRCHEFNFMQNYWSKLCFLVRFLFACR